MVRGCRAGLRPRFATACNFFFLPPSVRADYSIINTLGLKEYWDSPWATYSRGRSRWRNQFLVEHLKKAGIDRSKKQVASHIQVLRNMWRGEPGRPTSLPP